MAYNSLISELEYIFLSSCYSYAPVAPDLPLAPGKVQLREFEYIRHGTQALIINPDVVTGQVVSPTCGDTRTEKDFANHIKRTIDCDPEATRWHIVVDGLNTHKSETLVQYPGQKVAQKGELHEQRGPQNSSTGVHRLL